MARNPLQDTIAVVGVGSTPYGRDLQCSHLSLGLEASIAAIRDAGIDRKTIDGICGSGMTPLAQGQAGFLSLQGALAIDRITWGLNSWLGSAFVYAALAVFSGICDTCLVVQTYMREPGMSRSAAADPFRRALGKFGDVGGDIGSRDFAKRWVHSGEPYAAWMRRYMHDYGVGKDAFAYMAVNNRSHAARNPSAVMRNPVTLDDYHSSRVIWDPMQMLDMDVPVDCAEAHIITTAERAKDLPHKPVYIHAASLGGTRIGEYYENSLGWTENSHWVAAKGLWDRSELKLPDVDIFFPYDGYTIDAIGVVEAVGYCAPGEAGAFLAENFDPVSQTLRLNGRTEVTTHGGGLGLGRAGGANFYSEAVRQLRGDQGTRQVADAKAALINIGSFFHDPSAVMLRAD
jgi:acetyl-CoA acetyltransferase